MRGIAKILMTELPKLSFKMYVTALNVCLLHIKEMDGSLWIFNLPFKIYVIALNVCFIHIKEVDEEVFNYLS